MRKLTTLLVLSIFMSATYCQAVLFEINGKVARISNTNTITLEISGKPSLKLSSKIKEDSSFSFKGKIDKPKRGSIMIGYASTELWIDSGTITVNLFERKVGNSAGLYIKDLTGPEDSYLYFYKQIGLNLSLRNATPDQFDSFTKFKTSAFIDSVFQVRPASQVLPHYIDYYSKTLGAQLTENFYNRLSPQQKASDNGVWVSEYLKQQSVLRVGEVFENFSIPDAQGNMVQLDDIKAKLILLDFWDSYCGPCRANHPYLKKAHEKYKDSGLLVMSVSLDEKKTHWLKAVKKDSMIWLNVSDLKGDNSMLAKRSRISSIPYSILLDENKKIIGLDWSGQDLLNRIDRILMKQPQ